ncbi:MAG: hypothetical protein HRT88_03955 [Lentisphaeraceae bacterium]|nr:hypothetical protein [Lentisphaeraceae bacterium]
MSAFVFKIACPRCETAINISLGKINFQCSRCEFEVVVEDSENLLEAYKSGEVEDLEFVEEGIKGAHGGMDTGLRLRFCKQNGLLPEETAQGLIDDEEFSGHDDLILDNKTANTQIIQLTFDPAKYLDELEEKAGLNKTQNRKIALSKVIKYAEHAKAPVASKQEVLNRAFIGIGLLIAIVFIAALLGVFK